jgi:hypothetical protein
VPTAATMPNAPAQQSGATRRGGGSAAPLPMVPFIRASGEHRESTGIDVTRQLSAAGSQDLGVFDIPAYGYVRSLLIVVTASGGAGAPNFDENYPFSVLRDISFTEPNGAPIAQFNSGYEMYLANKYGGYRNVAGADPKSSPAYVSGAAVGDFTFVLRVPIELSLRDGLGSLPNQNAAATFKLRATLNSGAASAGLWGSTVPTTQPNVRVQVYLEAWDQPAAGEGGSASQLSPPALNTTQFWSTQVFNVNAGMNTLRLPRVGNYIRNLIFVQKRAAGTRANGEADFPDPAQIFLDTRPLDTVPKGVWNHTMYERSGFGGRAAAGVLTAALAKDTAGGLDNGVFVYDFTHEFDGTLGHENRDLWLPTMGSTRLELQGSFAQAGTLTVLTNDVAIAGPVFI